MMLLNCGVGEDSFESFDPAKRSNQSILKEISLEYSYFGHLMQTTDSLEKTLMLEGLKSEGEGGTRG